MSCSASASAVSTAISLFLLGWRVPREWRPRRRPGNFRPCCLAFLLLDFACGSFFSGLFFLLCLLLKGLASEVGLATWGLIDRFLLSGLGLNRPVTTSAGSARARAGRFGLGRPLHLICHLGQLVLGVCQAVRERCPLRVDLAVNLDQPLHLPRSLQGDFLSQRPVGQRGKPVFCRLAQR